MNTNLHILDILVNRVDLRRTLSKKMLNEYHRSFEVILFDAYVFNNAAIPNSIDRKVPLRLLKWHSRTIKHLNSVIDEILQRVDLNHDE